MRVPSLETRVVHVVGADGSSRYLTAASTWQWLCLAWTFRNFSQLPETVLSSSQRQMLARLSRNGAGDKYFDSSHVMGTIELPAKSCEELFQTSIQTVAAKVEVTPVKKAGVAAPAQQPQISAPTTRKPQVLMPPRSKRARRKAAFAARKAAVTTSAKPQHRSNRRMAVAVCVLLLLAALYAWQRLAQTGYVPWAFTVPSFGELTQSSVAAAPISAPVAPSSQAAPEQPSSPVETPAPTSAVDQSAQQTQAPAAPESLAADATAVAEAHAPVVTPREVTHPKKSAETVAIVLPEASSLRQDARPKRLIYPPAEAHTGKVILGLSVDANGAVDSVQVVSGDRALAKTAAETVKAWRYEATGGEQFKSVVAVTFMGDDAVMVRFPTQAELAAMGR